MKVFVESLPDGDADILPDVVYIVTNKTEEEVADESGTHIERSYEVIQTMTRVEWDKLNDARLRGVTETSAEHDELFAMIIEGGL